MLCILNMSQNQLIMQLINDYFTMISLVLTAEV